MDSLKKARAFNAQERRQAEKRQTRYTYTDGPMKFLLQQIVRQMQSSGRDAKIFEFYRHPDKQVEYLQKGTSKAGPFESAHQFFEAGDLIDPKLFWNVSDDYWEAISDAVEIVEEKFSVKLVHGWRDWGWDGPHIELPDWRDVREQTRWRWE